MPDYDLKPFPLAEYPTRMAGHHKVGDKFRGVIGCSRVDGLLKKTMYYDFLCETLHDSLEAAMGDAGDLFHRLETHPPTVAFNAMIYSLPTDEEHARAEQWLKNPHSVEEFEDEFPGARLLNPAPLGSSAISGH